MARMFLRISLATATLALALSAASAQQQVRVRGTIEAVAPGVLTVQSREGERLTVKIPDDVGVGGLVRASLADIKPNSFVGIAAMPLPDGKLRALEVLIFPEAMRGAGEGHRPWDLMPDSTMTNATVAETVARVDGATLTLKYKDGEKVVVVPPDAPIVTPGPADKSDLKPGAKVFIFGATKQADGSYAATRITVGRGGVDPPM